MIRSMTGFGRCEIQSGEKKFTVEMKGVNHPDFAAFSILTTEKYIENTAFGLYFFTSML